MVSYSKESYIYEQMVPRVCVWPLLPPYVRLFRAPAQMAFLTTVLILPA